MGQANKRGSRKERAIESVTLRLFKCNSEITHLESILDDTETLANDKAVNNINGLANSVGMNNIFTDTKTKIKEYKKLYKDLEKELVMHMELKPLEHKSEFEDTFIIHSTDAEKELEKFDIGYRLTTESVDFKKQFLIVIQDGKFEIIPELEARKKSQIIFVDDKFYKVS